MNELVKLETRIVAAVVAGLASLERFQGADGTVQARLSLGVETPGLQRAQLVYPVDGNEPLARSILRRLILKGINTDHLGSYAPVDHDVIQLIMDAKGAAHAHRGGAQGFKAIMDAHAPENLRMVDIYAIKREQLYLHNDNLLTKLTINPKTEDCLAVDEMGMYRLLHTVGVHKNLGQAEAAEAAFSASFEENGSGCSLGDGQQGLHGRKQRNR